MMMSRTLKKSVVAFFMLTGTSYVFASQVSERCEIDQEYQSSHGTVLCETFSESFVAVEQKDKYGFMNSQGKLVIPLEYDDVGIFSEGFASVEKNNKSGFINVQGGVVIPFEYDRPSRFSDGLARVRKDGRYIFIDKTGVEALDVDKYYNLNPFSYSEIFLNGLALVEADSKQGLINKKGELVAPIQYDLIDLPFLEGLVVVKQNDKYGFLNQQGQEVVSPKYDSAVSFAEGLARVGYEGRYGFINQQGQIVIPIVFEEASSFLNGVAKVKKDNVWIIINKKGEEDKSFKALR
ncbi:WG repeat-containing protein [Psychrobacter aquimaris]|uniref:WG repeat-containing protein n=1 Tax=Psychrobacter aquimaris TaxID=292733 RepID=UPI0039C5C92C